VVGDFVSQEAHRVMMRVEGIMVVVMIVVVVVVVVAIVAMIMMVVIETLVLLVVTLVLLLLVVIQQYRLKTSVYNTSIVLKCLSQTFKIYDNYIS
jgi:hypothetical protein